MFEGGGGGGVWWCLSNSALSSGETTECHYPLPIPPSAHCIEGQDLTDSGWQLLVFPHSLLACWSPTSPAFPPAPDTAVRAVRALQGDWGLWPVSPPVSLQLAGELTAWPAPSPHPASLNSRHLQLTPRQWERGDKRRRDRRYQAQDPPAPPCSRPQVRLWWLIVRLGVPARPKINTNHQTAACCPGERGPAFSVTPPTSSTVQSWQCRTHHIFTTLALSQIISHCLLHLTQL